jgi:hypothetical protein
MLRVPPQQDRKREPTVAYLTPTGAPTPSEVTPSEVDKDPDREDHQADHSHGHEQHAESTPVRFCWRNIRHMALLLILLALFSFTAFAESSSTTTGSATATGSASSTVIQRSVQTTNGVTRSTCVIVTWKAGQPAHRRPCHKARP